MRRSSHTFAGGGGEAGVRRPAWAPRPRATCAMNAARVDPEADEVDAQDDVPGEATSFWRRLSSVTASPTRWPGAVDLDDEPAPRPPHVEVDAAPGRAAQHLPLRLGDAVAPAQRREVELARATGHRRLRSRSTCRTNGRRPRLRTRAGPPGGDGPVVRRCCTTRQSTSAACRSVRHHAAARRAATSTGGRGRPGRAASRAVRVTRWTRTSSSSRAAGVARDGDVDDVLA